MLPFLCFVFLRVNIGNRMSEAGYQLSKRDYSYFNTVIYSYPLLLAHYSQVTNASLLTVPQVREFS